MVIRALIMAGLLASAGCGMTKRRLPVDGWNGRLLEWLVTRTLR